MFQYTIYTIPLLFIVVVSVVLTFLSYRRQPNVGSVPFAFIMMSVAIWSFGSLFHLSFTTLGMKFIGLMLVSLGALTLTFAWLLFGLEYSGNEKYITTRLIIVHALVTAVIIVLILTNNYHELAWTHLGTVDTGSYIGLEYTYGIGLYVAVAYAYVLLFLGTASVLHFFFRAKQLYRFLSGLLVVGVFIPWSAHAISMAGYSPTPYWSLTPFVFVVPQIMAFISIFKFKFLELLPLARDELIGELSTGIIVLDNDGEIVDINSRAKEILGKDGQLFGKSFLELLETDSSLEGYSELVERYEGEDEVRDELRIRRDGYINYYDVRVSPVFDPRDAPVGHMILVTDITERKERENELELQNRRLDDFASLVSHDLRNPLNVAQGYTDMAREEEDDEEYLDRIEESHDRIEDIIQDALELARQGRRVEETQSVELDDVVRDAWENVETHDTELVNDANATIEADRDRLLNIFENLFRNSVEHGGDEITVSVGATPEGFYVEDNGEGIPEDKRDKVLEQGYTTTHEGTGLGLSIVRSIVEAHGWQIEVGESDEGGARFEITGVTLKRKRE